MTTLRDATKIVYHLLRRQENPVQVSPTLSCTLEGHSGSICSISFLPDNVHLVSGSRDGTVRKWRVAGGPEVGKAMNHENPVRAIAVSPDANVVASGGHDSKIVFWNTETCEKIVESQKKHSGWIRSLSFAPDPRTVASGLWDESIILWNALTGERIAGPFRDRMSRVTSLAFSSSGDKIASGNIFGIVLMWDIPSQKLAGPPIRVSNSPLLSVVWSLDSRQVICGGHDGKIKFFNSSNGARLTTCRGHTNAIRSMALSPDGTFLASASSDCTVRLWSTSTHQQLASLKHPDHVNCVSISSNGRYLASGGDDHEVRIWRLQGVDPTSQEGKEDSAAFDTDLPSSPPQHVSGDDPQHTKSVDHPTTAKHEADDGDQPESSGAGERELPNITTANDSYLDLPAVLPPRPAVEDGVHTQLFDLGDPEVPQPNVTSNVCRGKWKKKAKESRQYLSQQIKHFRDGMLPRHGAPDMSGAAQPSSSQKLKDRISHIRHHTSLAPENARNGSSRQQLETDRKSPKVTLVSNARLEQRLVVASTDPPVQQEKLYLIMKDGKLVRRPDPPVQATPQTQGPQPTPASCTIPSSSTATQGQPQGQVVYNDDDEVCGCCGYLLIRG